MDQMKRQRLGRILIVPMILFLAGCVDGSEARAAPDTSARKGGTEATGHYEVVEDWLRPAPNHDDEWTWGEMAGVAADGADRILIAHRGDHRADDPSGRERRMRNMIVVADRNGNIVDTWSQWDDFLRRPHQIYVDHYDPERKVWVVDNGRMQVLVFSNDGTELLMEIGEPDLTPWDRAATTQEEARANLTPGPYELRSPADIAILPDGSFYVADGYWNTRVVKYNADGIYVREWGSLGDGPGEFDLVHGITVDENGRVYVADRSNSRIQVFTEDGEFIEEWPDILSPVNVYVTEDEHVWVVDRRLDKVLKYDRNGVLQYRWGVTGGPWRAPGAPASDRHPGGLATAHQLSVNEEGSVYIASYANGKVQKYVPRPDADPAKLIGPMLRLTE